LAGAKAVYVKLKSEDGFVPDPSAIEEVITDKTKIIIVLTPNNPTGSVYPEETLAGILDLAKKHNIVLISDEVYETLVFDGARHTSLVSLPGAKDHVVQVNSFSKTYAMTGLRVGYLAASADKVLQFLKYHHTVNISANVPSQRACITALQGPQDCVEEMRLAYLERRDMLLERLNDIPGIHCQTPQGTFFAFADIRELGIPSLEFAEYLVREAGVVLTNGSGFNYEGFIRLSYAADPSNIEEAMDRMKAAVLKMPEVLKKN
jgi:aminotransferase